MLTTMLSRKRIIIFLATAIVAVLGLYLWRDLRLSAKSAIPVPDIVVENIEVKRTIDGKDWILLSPKVEHKDGIVQAISLDVTITDKQQKTHLLSKTGTFSRSNNNITLYNASGVLKQGKGAGYKMTSGKVDYNYSQKKWFFADNLCINDEKMEISAPSGYFDTNSGECVLSGRGRITW